MFKLGLMLLLLACTGYSRRVQVSEAASPQPRSDSFADVSRSSDQPSSKAAVNPLKPLVMVLMAAHPSAGFNIGLNKPGFSNALTRHAPLAASRYAVMAAADGGLKIAVGEKIPAVSLDKGFPPDKVPLADFAKGKKIVLVGLPGAFTPT